MGEDRVTAFGGIVGRVLRDATSFGTAITAFILGAVVVAVSFLLGFIGGNALAQILVQVIIAVALARFALNGLSGEFRGTILSTAGGSWALAFAVAMRYLVLNLVWMVPLVFILWHAITSAAAASAATMGAGAQGAGGGPLPAAGGLALALPFLAVLTSKAVAASAVLILFGVTMLPPVFLIVAVRAERFGDIVSVDHWRAAFSGRFADLYVIYAIHGGGMGMMIILAVPVVLLGFSAASEFGILSAVLAFGYMCGLAVTLLGRLCGFFAFGEERQGPALAAAPAAPPAVAGFVPRLVPGGAAGAARGIAVAAEKPAEGAAAPPAGSDTAGEPAANDAGTDVRPPLPDAAERAAAARRRFETDRDGALGELRQLCEEYAPSPQIRQALALCLQQAGRAGDAIAEARDAVPLCLARGQVALAAELYAAFWKQPRELGLEREAIDTIAAALLKSGDVAKAVSAYGLALTMDPGDRKAIKGLMQAADQRLHKEGKAKDAARIYTFLLQYAADSPFAEDMRRGLSEAEARIARAS